MKSSHYDLRFDDDSIRTILLYDYVIHLAKKTPWAWKDQKHNILYTFVCYLHSTISNMVHAYSFQISYDMQLLQKSANFHFQSYFTCTTIVYLPSGNSTESNGGSPFFKYANHPTKWAMAAMASSAPCCKKLPGPVNLVNLGYIYILYIP